MADRHDDTRQQIVHLRNWLDGMIEAGNLRGLSIVIVEEVRTMEATQLVPRSVFFCAAGAAATLVGGSVLSTHEIVDSVHNPFRSLPTAPVPPARDAPAPPAPVQARGVIVPLEDDIAEPREDEEADDDPPVPPKPLPPRVN